jgi:hypothetical protein
VDWAGECGGIHWLGSINVPNFAPAPVPGMHGQYVPGASHDGIKGKALADIAKDGSLVGPYTGLTAN